MDLTVTVVSWNTRDLLEACLRSLAVAGDKYAVEVHVVDNASTDGSPEMVAECFEQVKLIRNAENAGFARANNQSWREARGRYWMLLNSDTEARPGAIDRLIEFMDAHPRAGLATARLVNPDGSPQFCAQPKPSIGRTLLETSRLHKLLPRGLRGRVLLSTYWSYDEPLRLGWTWGTALIARREAVEQVGPLAEEFFMYGEDMEWCLRMRRRGWEIWFCPEAEVVHHGGQSAGVLWRETERSRRISDGFYRALQLHRGPFYVRCYKAAMRLALSSQAAGARLRRPKRPLVAEQTNYDGRPLAGVSESGPAS